MRLYSGLVLLAYVTSHLLNHALGLVSLEVMEAGRLVFLALWRSPVGSVLLYGALALHVALGLFALFRRRTLRMAPWEAVHVLLSLSLPFLLALHVAATRGLHSFFGTNDLYAYVITAVYVVDPAEGLKQAAAIVVAWLHGALGVHYWLRLKPRYPRFQPALLTIALLVPTVALAGFLSAGREVTVLLRDPAWEEALRAAVDWAALEAGAPWAFLMRDWILALAVALPLATVLGRVARGLHERRRGILTLDYPGGRNVKIRPGMTVLEASRAAGIPHASVCGGRGRCSTCRVRVGKGAEALAPAGPEESRVLTRVGAPAGVRLACQTRPLADLEVTPLLPPTAQPRDALRRPHHLQGAERRIAVLFGDIRAFTRFAEQKLPFDVVFVINQYARAMGQAIEQAGGRVDKFIGDGVMALFGIDAGAEEGCRQAINAARAMASALDDLNRTLADDLDEPLRMGIGIHVGTVIVGEMGYAQAMSVTAIGDAVNTASRLESLTKDFACQLVLSKEVAEGAGYDLTAFPSHDIEVRGRSEALTVYTIGDAAALPEAVLNSRTGS